MLKKPRGAEGQRCLKLLRDNPDKSEAEIVEMMNQTEGQATNAQNLKVFPSEMVQALHDWLPDRDVRNYGHVCMQSAG
jgi:hypothetical protein